MRLVYAVLLPGIIVFASKENLLQVYALGGDNADIPTSGDFDPDADETASGESRALGNNVGNVAAKVSGSRVVKAITGSRPVMKLRGLGKMVKRPVPMPEPPAFTESTQDTRRALYDYLFKMIHREAVDDVQLQKTAHDELSKHFKNLWIKWLDSKGLDHKTQYLDEFKNSEQYRTMQNYWHQAIGVIPNTVHNLSFDNFYAKVFQLEPAESAKQRARNN